MACARISKMFLRPEKQADIQPKGKAVPAIRLNESMSVQDVGPRRVGLPYAARYVKPIAGA